MVFIFPFPSLEPSLLFCKLFQPSTITDHFPQTLSGSVKVKTQAAQRSSPWTRRQRRAEHFKLSLFHGLNFTPVWNSHYLLKNEVEKTKTYSGWTTDHHLRACFLLSLAKRAEPCFVWNLQLQYIWQICDHNQPMQQTLCKGNNVLSFSEGVTVKLSQLLYGTSSITTTI